MKRRHKRILGGILILILATAGVLWYVFNDTFTDTAERKADYSVTAMDFMREFQANDSLANKKYIEKIVSVKGVVGEIELVDTTANIKMSDTASGDYIIFAFQKQHINEAKALKKGETVTIKGSCSGGIHSEILDTRYISFKRSALDK